MKTVIITVNGGVVDVVRKPKDVKLIVKDYDTDGCDEDGLTEDKDGDMYVKSVY